MVSERPATGSATTQLLGYCYINISPESFESMTSHDRVLYKSLGHM